MLTLNARIGDNPCSRWHVDNYVGRAIVSARQQQPYKLRQSHTQVSYTGGESGATMFTPDKNVDFWELKNCGEAIQTRLIDI